MRTVTYNGRADMYRAEGRLLHRGIPTRVPNDLADSLSKNGDFTVEPEPSTEGEQEGES